MEAHFGRRSPESCRRVCRTAGAIRAGNPDWSTHRVAVGGCSTGYRTRCGFTCPRHFDRRHYRGDTSYHRQPVTEADLLRFVNAQAPVYSQVIEELTAGCKRTHWIWFIFPELK